MESKLLSYGNAAPNKRHGMAGSSGAAGRGTSRLPLYLVLALLSNLSSIAYSEYPNQPPGHVGLHIQCLSCSRSVDSNALHYPTTNLPRICSTSNDAQAKGFKSTVAMCKLHPWPFTDHSVREATTGRNPLG
jgi:hypothetical protein